MGVTELNDLFVGKIIDDQYILRIYSYHGKILYDYEATMFSRTSDIKYLLDKPSAKKILKIEEDRIAEIQFAIKLDNDLFGNISSATKKQYSL